MQRVYLNGWQVNIGSGNGLVPSTVHVRSTEYSGLLMLWSTGGSQGHISWWDYELKIWILWKYLATCTHIFSCDQAAIWLVQSVCLSVRPSVCHTFFTMFPSSYHHEIFRSYYQWQKWRPCKRSRSEVKVTEVNTQLNRFRTVTLVWIHIWWWNDAYSLISLRRGALLFFKVIRQISRSHGSKKRQIWPRLGVSGL